MLNRRTFMKTAAAVGLSSIVPLLQQSRASASAFRSVAPGIQTGDRVKDSAESLMAVERWEDLLDDLDCIELAARYTWLQTVAGKRISASGEALSFYAYCPICSSNGSHSLRLSENSFYCYDCQSSGSAIDFYVKAEKCSCGKAIADLKAMLDAGELRGRRPEQEQYWRILAESRRFYQEVLCNRAEGISARRWLSEQGIGAGTVERFGLGYAPVESDSLLKDHLLGQGYSLQAIEAAGVTLRSDGDEIKDRYTGMLIPISDYEGNLWGFFQNENMIDHPSVAEDSWVQCISSFSERRLRRLILPAPMWPRDLNKFDAIVMARTAWEVVVLHSIGVENAVYLVRGVHWLSPYAMRTARALAKTIIYPWEDSSRRLEEIMEQVGHEYQRVKLLALSGGQSLTGLLQQQGPEAVRTAIRTAIPLIQVLSV